VLTWFLTRCHSATCGNAGLDHRSCKFPVATQPTSSAVAKIVCDVKKLGPPVLTCFAVSAKFNENVVQCEDRDARADQQPCEWRHKQTYRRTTTFSFLGWKSSAALLSLSLCFSMCSLRILITSANFFLHKLLMKRGPPKSLIQVPEMLLT
jgi:hypothetical protein